MQEEDTMYHKVLMNFAFAGFIAMAGLTALDASAGPVESINAEATTAKVTVHPLRGHFSVLEGSGGNIGVFAGPDTLVMVDAGISLTQPRVSEALRSISSAPLRYLINTHYHWDHTDGNGWAHKAGATIIAQVNTYKRLSEPNHVDEWNHTFTPAPIAARPTVLVTNRKTLIVDGTAILLRYYGLAHTDGDLSVYLPAADILQTGDTWWNGYYPMIDIGARGSIDGMIRAANMNLAMSTDKTIIVPGHGPVGSRRQLMAYRDMLVAIRSKVAALKKSGMTETEAIAAKPTAAFDAKWGSFVIGPDLFTHLVYRGL
jgi:glyoxylase-like metal-dependent hydrolase (beta-lactamase superfamily II)